MAFVHLGIHSEFSIVDSIVRIPNLIKAAQTDAMPALALTDLSNLYAAVKFYKQCLEAGIKPILGSEIRLHHEKTTVTLLATNQVGWRHLIEIVSRGFIEGQHLGIPIVSRDWVFEKAEGLIVLLGLHSDVGHDAVSAQTDNARETLQSWHSHFGDRTYLALSRTRRAQEDVFIEQALKLAQLFHIGVIAHNDVRFIATEDYQAHEARICIAGGHVLADDKRVSPYSPEQHFKSSAEMAALFADIPEALSNTLEIAKRCNVSIELGKNYLPEFPIPDGYDTARFFAEVSAAGLTERLEALYPSNERDDNWPAIRKPYDDRLEYEIKTINDMGFPGYFLIVMDFIKWAKNNGVPVGPGRGSGAGSLVAYSLKITDLDPLRYELLFERFLNPERVSMPDFDVDFCIAGRDRVIEYVAEHYGRDAVSQIITFGTMAAKAVVRDVARVQGKAYGLADKISKLIPKTPGISLEEALEQEPQLKDIITNPHHLDYEDAAEIWEMATKLEGLTRNVGKHAGGVLIAPGKITDFSAVYCDDDGARVSQFDKDDVEAVGLVKFDFLGLRNLTVIDMAMTAINEQRQSEGLASLDLSKIALDDAPTYKLLQESKTTAVFQLESSGMKKYLGRLKPSNIDDIIAMCALYRPGPLDAGMVDMYIDRKQGREKVIYDHPDLETILQSTYGVIVYQEQVMQISQVLAGYSLGEADLLRRAMGKKKPEEMAQQRVLFVAGAHKRDIPDVISGGIFDLMEKFAGYGFNKSHSAAYGIVAYQTAWLKTHYPAEFMAAVLTSEMQNTDNVVFIIDDCRGLGLTILPPSVNHSDYKFIAQDDKTIIYGLGAIKGVGQAAMESVMQARQAGGQFKDLFDFCHRIDLKKANRRTLEALIRSGAMDSFATERASLMDELADAIGAAEQARTNRESGIVDLFGEVEAAPRKPSTRLLLWSDEERLKGEKDTLGLYLTGHPIDVYLPELSQIISKRLNDLSPNKRGNSTVFAGLIIDIVNFNTRYSILLDDGTARLEVSCSPERFMRYKDILLMDHVLVIEGDVSLRDGFDRPSARLLKAFSINAIRQLRAQNIEVVLDNDVPIDFNQKTQLDHFEHTLKPFTTGDARRIAIHFHLNFDFASAAIALPEHWHVRPEDALLRLLRAEFGKQAVRINYRRKTDNIMVGDTAHRIDENTAGAAATQHINLTEHALAQVTTPYEDIPLDALTEDALTEDALSENARTESFSALNYPHSHD